VEASKGEGRNALLKISSECGQMIKLAGMLDSLDLREIFLPAHKNPVYIMAGKAGCHASCPVPSAVLKCAEVAMGLALPKKVTVSFE
jgi:hypothetical protein